MWIYRAEHEDGGGPFYKKDGTPRYNYLPKVLPSNELYGADSLEHLKELIYLYGFNIKDFKVKKYKGKILSHNKQNGHISFIPKNHGEEI